jgi:hypothetical protein
MKTIFLKILLVGALCLVGGAVPILTGIFAASQITNERGQREPAIQISGLFPRYNEALWDYLRRDPPGVCSNPLFLGTKGQVWISEPYKPTGKYLKFRENPYRYYRLVAKSNPDLPAANLFFSDDIYLRDSYSFYEIY